MQSAQNTWLLDLPSLSLTLFGSRLRPSIKNAAIDIICAACAVMITVAMVTEQQTNPVELETMELLLGTVVLLTAGVVTGKYSCDYNIVYILSSYYRGASDLPS